MKQMTKYSRVAGYLEKIFKLLNEVYFENALSIPVITIQSTPRAYGHVSVANKWSIMGAGTKELNIGAGTLDRPIEETVSTMLHEMVHIYCMEKGIKDTSRGGSYHNKNFKAEAEKRDLQIDYSQKYGWTVTSPTEKILDFCILYELQDIYISRQEEEEGKASKGKGGGDASRKPSSTRKYICPKCGASVRATRQVNIICGDCNIRMEQEQ